MPANDYTGKNAGKYILHTAETQILVNPLVMSQQVPDRADRCLSAPPQTRVSSFESFLKPRNCKAFPSCREGFIFLAGDLARKADLVPRHRNRHDYYLHFHLSWQNNRRVHISRW